MPVFEDWLKEPLSIVNNIYASDPENADVKISEYFDSKLSSTKSYNAIPCLNDVSVNDLTQNCLVRFRCMIQDSANPEFYVVEQKIKHDLTNAVTSISTKYRDVINYPDGYEPVNTELQSNNLDDNSANCGLSQRMVFYCTSIPGETNWVKSAFGNRNHQNTSIVCIVKVYENFDKFKLNDLVEFIGILSYDDDSTTTSTNMEMDIDQEPSKQTDMLEPVSTEPRIHVLRGYHLMHNNPLLENSFYFEKNEMNRKDYWTRQKTNLLDTHMQSSTVGHQQMALLRQSIIRFLQEYFLFGDTLAAEYLLMNMISSVFGRKDVTVLGKFTLNLTNIPIQHRTPEQSSIADKQIVDEQNTMPNIFYKYFKELVVMSQSYKCSIDSLNKSNFIPSKDYNKDRLMSAMLQLPDNFHLLVDETGLSTGNLNEKGVFNLHALNDIIKWQKLNYDFGFHPFEFQTNIRLLVLSESKSLLNSDCQLKLNPCVSIDSHNLNDVFGDYERNLSNFFGNEANWTFLNNFRQYLTIVSNLDYNLTEGMQKVVEEDFVHMRQQLSSTNSNESKSRICVDDFHLLMVVARLQTISNGNSELSINEWNKAKNIEKERKERLQ